MDQTLHFHYRVVDNTLLMTPGFLHKIFSLSYFEQNLFYSVKQFRFFHLLACFIRCNLLYSSLLTSKIVKYNKNEKHCLKQLMLKWL